MGVACARKSSTPASAAMAAAVSGLSPVIMMLRMPMRAQLRDALLHAALDDVLQMDDAEQPFAVGDSERRAAIARNAVAHLLEVRRELRRRAPPRKRTMASVAPLRNWRPSKSTPLMRV